MTFKNWIKTILGHLPRPIDLANALGYQRGEIVSKWYKGIAYPDKNNCKLLSEYLKISYADVQVAVLKMRMEELNEV